MVSALRELLSAANGWVDMSHKPCAVSSVLFTGILINRPEEAHTTVYWCHTAPQGRFVAFAALCLAKSV